MRIRWERNCLSQNGPPPSAASGKHGDSSLRFNDIRGTAITMLSRGRQYATADYSSDRPLDLDHFSHNWKISCADTAPLRRCNLQLGELTANTVCKPIANCQLSKEIGRSSEDEKVRLHKRINGAPEEIRTPDPQIRSLVLYPAELRALADPQGEMARKRVPRANGRIAIGSLPYWQGLQNRRADEGRVGPEDPSVPPARCGAPATPRRDPEW